MFLRQTMSKKNHAGKPFYRLNSSLKMTAVLFFLFLHLNPLNADSFWDDFHWSFTSSLLHFAAGNSVDSDPAPILPSAGFSLALQFKDYLRLEVTEDIYFTNYEYNSALGYAMACNTENRSAFVMGFITGIQITAYLPIGRGGTAARFYAGPAADFRIVTLAAGLNHPADFTGDIETDPQLQTDAIHDYFWSRGRWFMPAAGAGIDFPITEKLLLGFDLRVWFPFYRLWADKDLPSIDGWRFGIGFRITPRKNS